jgi:predicted nucleic acid-binding protein
MTTAIDTNVLIALSNENDSLNSSARSALDAALGRGSLVIAAAPVFAELLAAPSRETFLDSFCRERASPRTGISPSLSGLAGRAFEQYVAGRRRQRDSGPRWILADFLIGAHGMQEGFALLLLTIPLSRRLSPPRHFNCVTSLEI